MTPSPASRLPWTCECGRKVPAHVEACRCGKARPVEVGATGAAEWAERQAAHQPAAPEAGGLLSAKSLVQFGGLVLVVALFFGSRYFNRYRASREVRAAMISELSKQVGTEVATGLVDKVHWACFEPNYHMSFKRRGGSSTFDDAKYSSCALRALEHEAGQMRTASQLASLEKERAEREARRQAAAARTEALSATATTPLPGQAPPESSTPSAPRLVALSGLKVLSFDRSSSTLRAEFLVIGSGNEKFVCRYSLACGPEQRVAGEGLLSCVTPRDAVRADGELHFTLSKPVPEGLCTLNLDLTDGSTGTSNRATATIP